MNEPIERFSTVVIENVEPAIDCGRYPVTRVAGQELEVAADIFKDGHDVLAAVLKWRPIGQPQWFETRMSEQINDRWIGICSFSRTGTYEYCKIIGQKRACVQSPVCLACFGHAHLA